MYTLAGKQKTSGSETNRVCYSQQKQLPELHCSFGSTRPHSQRVTWWGPGNTAAMGYRRKNLSWRDLSSIEASDKSAYSLFQRETWFLLPLQESKSLWGKKGKSLGLLPRNISRERHLIISPEGVPILIFTFSYPNVNKCSLEGVSVCIVPGLLAYISIPEKIVLEYLDVEKCDKNTDNYLLIHIICTTFILSGDGLLYC